MSILNVNCVYILLIGQLVLLLPTAVIFAFIDGWHALASVLYGGVSWIIPSIYFTKKMFKQVDIPPQKMLNNFFIYEVVKLLFSFGLVFLFIYFLNVKGFAFLCGYIVTIIATFLIKPFMYNDRRKK